MQEQEFRPSRQEFETPQPINTDPREQRHDPTYPGQEPYQEGYQGAGSKIYPQQRRRQRGWLVWLIIALFVVAAFGGLGRTVDHGMFNDARPAPSSMMHSQVYHVTGTPRLVINATDGHISIHTGNSAGIVTDKGDNGRDANGLSVTRPDGNTGTTLNITASDSNADIEITVPDQVSIDAHDVNGQVEINGTNGQVSAQTTDGEIKLENVQGQFNLQSQDGQINGSQVNGQVQATSADGSIDIHNSTLSGQSSLSSKGGSITFEGSLDPAGNYTFQTGDSSVDLSLPANSSFQLNTSGGSLQNEFGSSTVGSAPHATITINTGGGSINLHKSSQ